MKKIDNETAAFIAEETAKFAKMMILHAFEALQSPLIRVKFPESMRAEILHVQYGQMFSMLAVLELAHVQNKALSEIHDSVSRIASLVDLRRALNALVSDGKVNVYYSSERSYYSLKK